MCRVARRVARREGGRWGRRSSAWRSPGLVVLRGRRGRHLTTAERGRRRGWRLWGSWVFGDAESASIVSRVNLQQDVKGSRARPRPSRRQGGSSLYRGPRRGRRRAEGAQDAALTTREHGTATAAQRGAPGLVVRLRRRMHVAQRPWRRACCFWSTEEKASQRALSTQGALRATRGLAAAPRRSADSARAHAALDPNGHGVPAPGSG